MTTTIFIRHNDTKTKINLIFKAVFMKQKRIRSLSALMIFCLLAVLPILNSCKHDGTPADQLPQINFTEQVLPIFQNSCAISGCHNANGSESHYVFNDYAGIMQAIVPGNADKSKAYKSITSALQLMPPNSALSTSQRTTIWLWIEQGANP